MTGFSSEKKHQERRGRRKVQKRTKKCFHAWNAYVMTQPVSTIKKLKGREVKSGDHIRRLRQRWSCMSLEERKKFYDIAIAPCAQMHSENSQEA